MRRLMPAVLAVLAAAGAQADLQTVQVGGELRIRFRHFGDVLAKCATPAAISLGRAYGPYSYNSALFNDLNYVEQRSLFNLQADFTDEVAAYIEFESYDVWGEDFRSNWVTGADARAATGNDVEVYQAYIDANQLWGAPLRLRIGRQELIMGKAWLVGSRISATRGISYDGVRLTYDTDNVTVDAWWAKMAENSFVARDDDSDFYGIYGTYKGFEHLDLSAYWLFNRDGRSGRAWNGAPVADIFGWDDYDPTEMHTVGFRAFGATGGWDYDLELAYQFGEADAIGSLFTLPITGRGDDSAEYDNWAADFGLGYTFDAKWSPRVSIGGVYFGGEDDREVSFFEWLNPFQKPDASVSFNRITSGIWYNLNMDIVGGSSAMTNFYQVRAGLDLKPSDAISTGLTAAYYGAVEHFHWPIGVRRRDGLHPFFPDLGFLTKHAGNDIGVSLHGWLRYQYSPDWWVTVGWEHLFAGGGLKDGNFINKNGLELLGGNNGGDPDYIYVDTQLRF